MYIIDGKTMNEISKEIKVGKGTIHKFLKSEGLSRDMNHCKQIYKID